MIDRLAELQRIGASNSKPLNRPLLPDTLESGGAKEAEPLSHEFKVIEQIKTRIDSFPKKVAELKKLRFEAVDALSSEEEKKISKAVQALVRGMSGEATQLKGDLESFGAETEEFARAYGASRAAEIKIRRSLQVSAMKKLSSHLTALHEEHEAFNAAMRDKGQRTVQMVYPEASPEEVKEMLHLAGTGGSSNLVQQRVARGISTTKMALADLKDTLTDIKLLEDSVREVHSSIHQLDALVAQQGDFLDAIEAHINATEEFSSAAHTQLVQATLFQRSAGRNKLIFMAALIILGIILVLYLWSFVPSFKSQAGGAQAPGWEAVDQLAELVSAHAPQWVASAFVASVASIKNAMVTEVEEVVEVTEASVVYIAELEGEVADAAANVHIMQRQRRRLAANAVSAPSPRNGEAWEALELPEIMMKPEPMPLDL